jgi:hypothetical protein
MDSSTFLPFPTPPKKMLAKKYEAQGCHVVNVFPITVHKGEYLPPGKTGDSTSNQDMNASFHILSNLLFTEGRAIAQAVSRWLPIAAARVQTRV